MLIDFLQNVQFRLLEEQAKRDAPPGREWSTPYKWYINPVLRCPYCEEWVETGRVWVIDEEECKVVALYKVTGGKALNVTTCHPHVGTAGKICMGSACTPAEALFHGLSEDAYVKPYDWLPEVLEHQCAEMDEREDENYIVCDDCGDRYHIDESYYSEYADGHYCSGCYWEVHWRCDQCNGEWHEDSDELSHVVRSYAYCSRCFSDRYFICDGCDETCDNEQYRDEGLCNGCYDDRYEECVDCSGVFPRSDHELNSDGFCSECRPPEEADCSVCSLSFIAEDLFMGICEDCQKKGEEEEDAE